MKHSLPDRRRTLLARDIEARLAVIDKPRGERTQEDLIRGAHAENTYRTYASSLRDYANWVGMANPFPATPVLIAEYLTERAKVLAPGTLAHRVAALSFIHQMMGYTSDPTSDQRVRKVLRGAKRLMRTQDGYAPEQAASLSFELMRRVIDALGDTPRDIRDRSILLTGMVGALRQSELSGLRLEQLHWADEGIAIPLGAIKQDQLGQKLNVTVLPRLGGPYCPAGALEAWLGVLDRSSMGAVENPRPGPRYRGERGREPLYRGIHRSGRLGGGALTGTALNTLIRKRLRTVGVEDLDRYSVHSLRASFVTLARELHIEDRDIARQTHHRNMRTLDTYDRPEEAFASNPAKWIAAALGGVAGAPMCNVPTEASGGADEIQRLRDALEWLEVQAVTDIADGWVSIPRTEWDAVMESLNRTGGRGGTHLPSMMLTRRIWGRSGRN